MAKGITFIERVEGRKTIKLRPDVVQLQSRIPLTPVSRGTAVFGVKSEKDCPPNSELDDIRRPYTLHNCHPTSVPTNNAYPSGENIILVTFS